MNAMPNATLKTLGQDGTMLMLVMVESIVLVGLGGRSAWGSPRWRCQ